MQQCKENKGASPEQKQDVSNALRVFTISCFPQLLDLAVFNTTLVTDPAHWGPAHPLQKVSSDTCRLRKREQHVGAKVLGNIGVFTDSKIR